MPLPVRLPGTAFHPLHGVRRIIIGTGVRAGGLPAHYEQVMLLHAKYKRHIPCGSISCSVAIDMVKHIRALPEYMIM